MGFRPSAEAWVSAVDAIIAEYRKADDSGRAAAYDKAVAALRGLHMTAGEAMWHLRRGRN
jgi:hypothetical protein